MPETSKIRTAAPGHDRGGDRHADGGQQHRRRGDRARTSRQDELRPPSKRISTSATTRPTGPARRRRSAPRRARRRPRPSRARGTPAGSAPAAARRAPAVTTPTTITAAPSSTRSSTARCSSIARRLGGPDATGPACRRALRSGAKENRTPDLFHAMEALYQLSYSPVGGSDVRHRRRRVANDRPSRSGSGIGGGAPVRSAAMADAYDVQAVEQPLAAAVARRGHLRDRQRRPAAALLRPVHVPVPVGRGPHGPRAQLHLRRPDRPLPDHERVRRAQPDRLRQLRAAGRERRDQDRRAPPARSPTRGSRS